MTGLIITVPDRAHLSTALAATVAGWPDWTAETFVDVDRRGIWWNTARALRRVVEIGAPCLMLQDDASPIDDAPRHLATLAGHLCGPDNPDGLAMISAFTPPQKRFSDLAARGCNMVVGTDFLWAQMYLVTPRMAEAALDVDTYADVEAMGFWDEVRYRVAAQYRGLTIGTVVGSLCRHDLSVKSTVGTPSSVGGHVRDTRVVAGPDTDFSTLRTSTRITYADAKKYVLPRD